MKHKARKGRNLKASVSNASKAKCVYKGGRVNRSAELAGRWMRRRNIKN